MSKSEMNVVTYVNGPLRCIADDENSGPVDQQIGNCRDSGNASASALGAVPIVAAVETVEEARRTDLMAALRVAGKMRWDAIEARDNAYKRWIELSSAIRILGPWVSRDGTRVTVEDLVVSAEALEIARNTFDVADHVEFVAFAAASEC